MCFCECSLCPNSFFINSDPVRNEVQQRFPTVRSAPYIPRHAYRAPAGARSSIPRRRASTVVAIAKTFTKDVVLLTRHDGDRVPRGARRAALHDSGRIANMVDFKSCWSEQTVREHIEHLFKGVIDTTKPYPR